jgi:cell division protein FtsW
MNQAKKIFLFSLALSLIGLILVYEASVVEAFTQFGDKFHFVKRQLVWIIAGFAVYFFVSRLNLKFIKKITPFLFAASLISLILVLVPGLGLKLQGARRWLNLGLFGFQPSEFLKLNLILYLSLWLEKKHDFGRFLIIVGFCLGLLMFQPDLGTSIIVGSTAFIIYYLSGAPINKLLTLFLIASSVGFVLIISSPYRINRVHTFLDPTSDPLGRSYHINQVLLSIGSGGWTGVGIGRSLQKYSYLPEATTDSIFAILSEELGFFGSFIFIVLLFYFCFTCFQVSINIKDRFARLVAGGVAGLITVQTFVNLAAMVALVPLTGVPLPFISYGGSSMITTFAALGVLKLMSRQ